MQPLDLVFPEEVLTEAEQDMCFEVFAHNAAVRKQLRIMGQDCGKELLGISTQTVVQRNWCNNTQ